MNVFNATADFERWLAKRLPIVRQDIALKHLHMAEAAFPFFRATFYRWLQLRPDVCPVLARAPSVFAVGDLHIEHFGTWRDEEGRLICGVIDLAEAIEEGYRDALASGGKAFVLAEQHQWLRLLALSKLRDPVRFWEKMQQCPPYSSKPPAEARKLIEDSLPEPCRAYQLKRRIAGLGSLGHPRILALSTWQGAFIAREAKGIRTSAWAWFKNGSAEELYGAKLVNSAIRVKDPCVQFHGHWLVRRLAPDCSRIELSSLPKEKEESRLLYDMGWETGNMHFGSPRAIPNVKRDLASRRGRWLHKAAKAMYKATLKDWGNWRSDWKKSARSDAKD